MSTGAAEQPKSLQAQLKFIVQQGMLPNRVHLFHCARPRSLGTVYCGVCATCAELTINF